MKFSQLCSYLSGETLSVRYEALFLDKKAVWSVSDRMFFDQNPKLIQLFLFCPDLAIKQL